MNTPDSPAGRRTGSLIGYARISPGGQFDGVQIEALIDAGVPRERLHVDEDPRPSAGRSVLDLAIERVRSGDTLVVWRLERIATSIAHLVELVEQLEGAGGYLRSLADGLETRPGEAIPLVDVLRTMARLEKDLGAERARVGREKAKRKGVSFGRRPVLLEADMPEVCRLRYDDGWTWKRIGDKFGVKAGTAARRARSYERTLAANRKPIE